MDTLFSVMAFLRQYIQSVDQLDILVLLKGTAGTDWSACEVGCALSSDPKSAASRLRDLHLKGLLEMQSSPNGERYQYKSLSGQIDATIRKLQDAYSADPHKVVRFISSNPDRSDARTFVRPLDPVE